MANDAIRVELIGSPILYFSYGQIIAYDSSEQQPGSLWTKDHVRQGFVRREHSIAFGTIVPHGNAELRVFFGEPLTIAGYQRVICVPIALPSGTLCLEGPEEYPIERFVRVVPGSYGIYAAQVVVDEDLLKVDLFVSITPNARQVSRILRADDELEPPDELLEGGEVAH